MGKIKKKKPVGGLIIWCSINFIVLIFINYSYSFRSYFGMVRTLYYVYMIIVAICLVSRLVGNSGLPKNDDSAKKIIANGERPDIEAISPSEQLINKQRENHEIFVDKKKFNEMFLASESLHGKAVAAGKLVTREIKKAGVAVERGIVKATDRVAQVLKNLAKKGTPATQQSVMLTKILQYTKAEKQYDLFYDLSTIPQTANIASSQTNYLHVTQFDWAKQNSKIAKEKNYILKTKSYKSIYAEINRNKVSYGVAACFSTQYANFKNKAAIAAINRNNANINIFGGGGFDLLENLTRFNGTTVADNNLQNNAKNQQKPATQNKNYNNIPDIQDVFGDVGKGQVLQVFDGYNDANIYNVPNQAVNDGNDTSTGYITKSTTAKGRATAKDEKLDYYLGLIAQGDESANFEVGQCYDFGYGTPINKKLAVDYYKKAAAVGVAAAENNLALKYDTADGTCLNKVEAARLYLSAAQKGDIDAMFNIGNKYVYGNGIGVNVPEGIKYLAKSAESGNAKAANSLGVVYYSGRVTAKNIEAAGKWFMAAALSGNAMGMYNYALILSNENSQKYNKNESKYWFKKASEKGVAEATEKLNKLL